MKTRDQIEDKYKWDLDMFKTTADIDAVFDTIEKLTKVLPSYYGKFNDKDKFFEYFNNYKDDWLKIEKMCFYISNTQMTNLTDVSILKLAERFSNSYNKLNKAISFVDPQIDDLDEDYLLSLLNDERAKDLDVKIKEVIKNKPHRLDEKTNEILSKMDNSFNNSYTIYDLLQNSEMKYQDAKDSKGKTHKVDNSTYTNLISSKDREIRKSAFNSMINAYADINKTISELYLSSVKTAFEFSRLQNYNSTLERMLHNNDVPLAVFEKNIEQVFKHKNLFQNFIKTQAKISGIKDFSTFDIFEDKKVGGKIKIEKAQEIMLKSLAPLGVEYLKIVNHKLNDKSIDYLTNKDKYSGGYCDNAYDTKTVILLNWTYDYDSLSALVHEMGHCVNAEYFNSAQPMEKADTTTFAAEIASTVNELLLGIYIQNNCTTKHKSYYINQFLNQISSSIFKTTMYTEFELFAHNSIQNELLITYQDLNDKCYKLNKKYYGNSCLIPNSIKYQWSKISHFYRPFYYYCYSTGMITAINIVSNILKDSSYVNKYIMFLKNGLNKPAYDILKEIGIDLATDTPYEIAFDFFKQQLEEYKKLSV
ncbi:MAG: oligoendopeptidase F family protein [Clostridia bacterium]|nr:oligoendopeptidase F family protein [Clostridia bacterium]